MFLFISQNSRSLQQSSSVDSGEDFLEVVVQVSHQKAHQGSLESFLQKGHEEVDEDEVVGLHLDDVEDLENLVGVHLAVDVRDAHDEGLSDDQVSSPVEENQTQLVILRS